jgi:hypothetical protein
MPQFGGKDSKRHFTVVMGGKEHGLYVSSTPSSAAKKAVTKLCSANKSKKVEFSIREITQGSKKKTYGPYEGYIEKLKEPIKLKSHVIEHKPVAKLIGNSGAKKGGMMGGTRIYECYTKIPKTNLSFKIEKLRTAINEHIKNMNRIFYCLTIINNPDLETTVLDYEPFLSHLNHSSQDEFIRYLIDKSNEQKKNLSINYSRLAGGYDFFIRYFLKKCYDIPDSNKRRWNFSKQRYENSNKTFMIKDNVTLERYNRNMTKIPLAPPRNVDIEEWIDRINEWLNE